MTGFYYDQQTLVETWVCGQCGQFRERCVCCRGCGNFDDKCDCPTYCDEWKAALEDDPARGAR